MSGTDEFKKAADQALDSLTVTMKIRRLLEGRPPDSQGAILADLLAMWLAGHVDPDGDDAATEGYRELLLMTHLESVRRLVPVNFKLFIEPKLKRRQH